MDDTTSVRQRHELATLAHELVEPRSGAVSTRPELLRLKSFQRLLADMHTRFAAVWPPLQARVIAWLAEQPLCDAVLASRTWKSHVAQAVLRPSTMRPFPIWLADNRLPILSSLGQLAEWLGCRPTELDSWARRYGESPENHRGHYRSRWITRPGRRPRLLEIPKPRLREAQRQILDNILVRVPVHCAAHAYVRGRDVASAVAPHVGQAVVLGIDVADFFPSITLGRVFGLFRSLGYPEDVARFLARMCTRRTPAAQLAEHCARDADASRWHRFRQDHLPQGAPTSPALANLVCHQLDLRLCGLATRFGAQYTRYADDLLFSGPAPFRDGLSRFRVWANAILLDEGFALAHRKTRIMPAGQTQACLGLTINHRPQVSRAEFDVLKAMLHNCKTRGPTSQNQEHHPQFQQHLWGRILWVMRFHPERGEKLAAMYRQIAWNDG